MSAIPEVSLHSLARNGLVLAGLLLFGVGVADMVAGRSKLDEYRAVTRTSAVTAPHDPAALFPAASEAEQQYNVARAKLGFYQLLFLSGQVLAALGLILLAVGVFQLRLKSLRGRPETLPSH